MSKSENHAYAVEQTDSLANNSVTQAEMAELNLQSERGAQTEHALTFFQAVKLYRRAVFWALFFCIGQMMTAYDPQVLGNLFAMPAFQREFGYLYEGEYIIAAPWQTGLLMGVPIGQVVGSLGAGYPLAWYGRKKTFGVCVIGTMGCIFIQFFARSLSVLLVGELIAGLILGFYAVITPTYASEICPVALRGVLTASINLFIVTGQLMANGVCAGTQRLNTHWAYSAPFATQWLWPVFILICLPFAPESKIFAPSIPQRCLRLLPGSCSQVRGGLYARVILLKPGDH
jgi:MFS transporter, SP family, general alpha glucoside:H+ symporter